LFKNLVFPDLLNTDSCVTCKTRKSSSVCTDLQPTYFDFSKSTRCTVALRIRSAAEMAPRYTALRDIRSYGETLPRHTRHCTYLTACNANVRYGFQCIARLLSCYYNINTVTETAKNGSLEVWRRLSVRFMLQVPMLVRLVPVLLVLYTHGAPTIKCKVNIRLIYSGSYILHILHVYF